MQSLLGFNDTSADIVDRSSGSKLVPWISWDEWNSVKESLFSSSPSSISSALQRITAWRSRGCLPVVVEITASIIEIQQKDPYFRDDLNKDRSDSEEVMAMLYTMAIMRLVNGVVEKTRKKTEISIGEAADVIDIPRTLIDIRHEGSHRDLPSLRLTRIASIKALDWLKSYYWEPQKAAIFSQADGTASIRKEIKSRLRELASCLEAKQGDKSGSLVPKEKSSKKQITKALKHVIRLYSSYNSEVVSVFIELLLKCSESTNFTSLPEDVSGRPSKNQKFSVFDDWKNVITKLSDKEPQFILTLIKAVLTKIGTREVCTNGSGELSKLDNTAESYRIRRLSNLCEWLIRNVKELKGSCSSDESAAVTLPKTSLVELFRQALMVSSLGNEQLMSSALILAHAIGDTLLVQKLEKLRLLGSSKPGADVEEYSPTISSSERILAQQEDSIRQAAEKLETVKVQRTKNLFKRSVSGGGTDMMNNSDNKNNKWVVAKSWSSCPIGMLPSDVGYSGCLPLLDCDKSGGDQQSDAAELIECEGGDDGSSRKRPFTVGGDLSDTCPLKKKKKREMGNFYRAADTGAAADEAWSETGTTGHLMVGGVWKKVGAEEMLAIASGVRILV